MAPTARTSEEISVPFMDLEKAHEPVFETILEEIRDLASASRFVGARHLHPFEGAFARYTSAPEAVGCSSGTSALVLALRAAGIGPGDEVITAVNTFIATAEAISEVGATPVFVDVDPLTALLDLAMVEEAITSRTRALVVVHLYGQPVDLDGAARICDRHSLLLVQDAAQAHGARWDGRSLGEFPGLQCYSFYPGKNLGAWGDAGAVCGGDRELLKLIRALRDHGRLEGEKYLHARVGTNARLDALQAVILRVKLSGLEEKNEARRQFAARYTADLTGVGDLDLTAFAGEATPVHHLFVVRTARRDALRSHLADLRIATGIHYPVPLHLQPAFADLNLGEGAFPVAEDLARRSLSLPFFPEMSGEQVSHVVEGIRSFFRD